MCGISAVFNSKHANAPRRSNKYSDLFKDMLIAGAVRGTDSTGAFQITDTGAVYWGKAAQASGVAASSDSLSGIIEDVHNCSINVGHVRAATAGKVVDNNAHPFIGHKDNDTKDYIIGVHNGTLYGWEWYDKFNSHEVDSSWAFSELAAHGVDAFADFYGAYAMVWYDTEHKDRVWMARNDERPLHIARSKDKSSIVVASEAGMLQWLCQRNSIDIGEVYSLDDGYLFSVDVSQLALEVKLERALPEATWTQTPSATPSYVQQDYLPALPSPTAPITNYAKMTTIADVKESLRLARYRLVDESLTAVEDDGPIELGPTERITRAEDGWYDSSSTRDDDMKRAMWDGSYGTIVMYEGVDYDTFTDCVVGEITSPSMYNLPIAYIKDLDKEEASAFVNSTTPMVVVGMRYFMNEAEYIVVPLNEKGKEALAA